MIFYFSKIVHFNDQFFLFFQMFVLFSNFSSDGLRYNEFFKPARTFLFKTIILNNLKTSFL